MLNWNRIPPLARIPLKYGILGGTLSMAFVISFYYFGKHPFFINPVFDIRIPTIAILLVFSLREVRDYFFGGILYFWQGLFGSFIYLLTMSCISSWGVYLFGTYYPRFVVDYRQQGLDQIEKFSPDAIEQIGKQAVDELRNTLPGVTIGQMVQTYTFQTMIFGAFITIIISVILRRQPKTL